MRRVNKLSGPPDTTMKVDEIQAFFGIMTSQLWNRAGVKY